MGKDCTHGMPTPASCWECMEEGNMPTPSKPKTDPPEPDSAPFMAEYEGTCSGCSFSFPSGTWIVRMTDGSYRHSKRCLWDG